MFIRTLTAGSFDRVVANLEEETRLLAAAKSFGLLFMLAYEPTVQRFQERKEYPACRKVYLKHAREICLKARARGFKKIGNTTKALGDMASSAAEARLMLVTEEVGALSRMPAFDEDPCVAMDRLHPRVGEVPLRRGESSRLRLLGPSTIG